MSFLATITETMPQKARKIRTNTKMTPLGNMVSNVFLVKEEYFRMGEDGDWVPL